MRIFRQLWSRLYGGIAFRSAVRLLIAPFFLSLGDLTVTLLFQPESYWEGDRSTVVEGNPIARWALSIHPLCLIPGFLGWYAVVFPLIFKSPAWMGLRVHVFLVLGHLVMICGWLVRYGEFGTGWAIGVCSVAIPVSYLLFRPYRWQWSSEGTLNLRAPRGRLRKKDYAIGT